MGDDGGVVDDVPESDSDMKWNADVCNNGLDALYEWSEINDKIPHLNFNSLGTRNKQDLSQGQDSSPDSALPIT